MPPTPRLLHGHPTPRPSESFAELAAYCRDHRIEPDIYGSSEWLQALEQEIAALLGHEAAMFSPSGTMAQQIALRVWASRKNATRVAFHPTSHLEVHEQQGYKHLHGLEATLVADPLRMPSLADVEGLPDDTAALLLELPMREIGGQLLPLDELDAIRASTRARGIALHLDGARLYEAAAGYGATLSEVAGRFDSVYVSFYKGIGGLAGALLAGPADFIGEARIWLRRHGGNLVQMTPFTVAAKLGLEQKLDRFSAYLERTHQIHDLLAGRYGRLSFMPSPVQVNMVHLIADVPLEELNARRLEAGRVTGLLPTRPFREDLWGRGVVTELYVGESAMAEPDETIVASFDTLMGTGGTAPKRS